jgi:hypothetical protein
VRGAREEKSLVMHRRNPVNIIKILTILFLNRKLIGNYNYFFSNLLFGHSDEMSLRFESGGLKLCVVRLVRFLTG